MARWTPKVRLLQLGSNPVPRKVEHRLIGLGFGFASTPMLCFLSFSAPPIALTIFPGFDFASVPASFPVLAWSLSVYQSCSYIHALSAPLATRSDSTLLLALAFTHHAMHRSSLLQRDLSKKDLHASEHSEESRIVILYSLGEGEGTTELV
jgi:hypothetical protein